jgi:hypothetical protein
MASDRGNGVSPSAPQHLALDPAAWQLISHSAGRLSRNQDAFIRQLHDDFRELIPDSAEAETSDMWAFCERMVQALLWVTLTDQPLRVVADELRQVGAQNWYEGFPDEHYTTLAHALVQTVHYLGGNDWSASTGSAWISYFMWLRPHLLAGAQQAAARHSAAQNSAAQNSAAQNSAAQRAAGRHAAAQPRAAAEHETAPIEA